MAVEPGTAPSGSSAEVDINAAPSDDLRSFPSVGPVLAEWLIAGRPYRNVDDLARVEGLGGSKLEWLRNLVVVGPAVGEASASPAAIRLRVEWPAGGPGGDVRLATENGREVILPGDLRPGPVGQGGDGVGQGASQSSATRPGI